MLKKRGNENSQMRAEEVEALNDVDEAEDLGTFKRASSEVIAARKIIKSKRTSDKLEEPSSTPSFPAFSSTTSFSAMSNPFSNFTGLSQPPKTTANLLSSTFTTTTSSTATEPPKSVVFPERKSETTSTVTAPATATAVPFIKETSNNQSEFNTKLKKLNSSFSQWVQRQMVEHPLSLWTDGLKDYIKYYDALVAKYGVDVTSENFIPESPSEKTSADNSKSSGSGSGSGLTLFQPSSSAAAPTTTTESSSSSSKATSSFSSFHTFGTNNAFTAAPNTTTNTFAAPPPAAASSIAAPVPFSVPASSAPAAPLFASSTAFSIPNNSFSIPSIGGISSSISNANNGAQAAPALKFNFSGANSFASSSSFGSSGGSSSIFSTAFPSATTTTFGAPTTSFGFAPQANNSNPTEDGGEDGDDGGEPILEPEKAIRDVNDTDEILHEASCKLFRYDKESKEWRGTGKGTFRITRSPDTRKQRMLVRNIIGKIIFNASFYKGMDLIVKDGKTSGIQFFAAVAEEEFVKDDKGNSSTKMKTELKSFMLKFKPTELAKAAEMMRAGIASLSA